MMAYTLRTTEQQEVLISKLCDSLEIKTVNKLFVYLLNEYESNQQYVLDLQSRIDLLEHDLVNAVDIVRDTRKVFESVLSFDVNSLESDFYRSELDFSNDKSFR